MKNIIKFSLVFLFILGLQSCNDDTISEPITDQTEGEFLVNISIIGEDGEELTRATSAAGSVTGGGLYNSGQECTVAAHPNSGYELEYLRDNSGNYSGQSSYTFPVFADRYFSAKFRKKETITITDEYSIDYENLGLRTFHRRKRTISSSDNASVSFSAKGKESITTIDYDGRQSTNNSDYTATCTNSQAAQWVDRFEEWDSNQMTTGRYGDITFTTYTLTIAGTNVISNSSTFPASGSSYITNGKKYTIEYKVVNK